MHWFKLKSLHYSPSSQVTFEFLSLNATALLDEKDCVVCRRKLCLYMLQYMYQVITESQALYPQKN